MDIDFGDDTRSPSVPGKSPPPPKTQAKSKNDGEDSKDDSVAGIVGTRWSTLLMVLLWGVSIAFRVRDLDWTNVECAKEFDDDFVDEQCMRHSAIYRVVTIVIAMLTLQAVLAIVRVAVYDKFWLSKFAVMGVCCWALLMLPVPIFDDKGFAWIARIGAFAFIIFQQIILLDFAYYWNSSWTGKAGTLSHTTAAVTGSDSSDCRAACKSIWLVMLVGVSLVYIAVFLVAMAMMYRYFGGDGCGDNVTVITVSLVGVLAAITLQMFVLQNGSIIASGIVAAYVTYLTYVSVSLNPREECNPTNGHTELYGVGPFIVGIVISFVSILWISIMTSRRLSGLVGTGSSLGVNVLQGRQSSVESFGAKDQLAKRTRVSILNLSFVFILISFYIAMIMTNWGTVQSGDSTGNSPAAGSTSMWMQAIGAWIALGLYIVGMVLPKFKFFPESIWELQPKFG